jgi:hypothetical protein
MKRILLSILFFLLSSPLWAADDCISVGNCPKEYISHYDLARMSPMVMGGGQSAAAAVEVDAHATPHADLWGTAETASMTIGANATLLIASVMYYGGTAPSSVKWGGCSGTDMTLVHTNDGSTVDLSVYSLVSPTPGASTICVAFASAPIRQAFGGTSFKGTSTSTPINAHDVSTEGSRDPETVTSAGTIAAGNMAYTSTANFGESATPTSSGTRAWAIDDGNPNNLSTQYVAGAGSAITATEDRAAAQWGFSIMVDINKQ